MPYTPDATVVTEPTDSQKASSMGLEFRTLKLYIRDVLLAGINSKAPLTGAGTSGVWPISISGLAATATLAANATAAASLTTAYPAAGNAGVKTGRNSWGSGVYSYRATSDPNAPDPYFAAIGFGLGAAGSVELGSSWFGGRTIYARSLRDTTDNWTAWKALLDETNFNSYAPKLDGTGATGSWSGITLPWSRITGTPTTLAGYGITDGGGGGGGSGVSSFNSRTGAVSLSSGDVTAALGYTPYNSSNPSNFTTLAAVAGAGYQTSSGSVAFATSAGSASTATTATNVSGGSANVTGLASTGDVVSGGLLYGHGGGSGLGSITVSSSAPSGGANGDLWFQV